MSKLSFHALYFYYLNMYFRGNFLITLALLVVTGSLFGQPIQKRTAVAQRIHAEQPRIDGLLNDSAWAAVPWENNFTQRQPLDGRMPSQPTSFKVIYDNSNLYVAIRAWDSSPDSIVSRLTRRDDGDGDAVGIELDSYMDSRTSFSFIVYSSGAKSDMLKTNNGSREDNTWDPIWTVHTSIDSLGWVAELLIPFNQLRFNRVDEQRWGMQVGRYLFRKDELSLWQPIPMDSPGWVHMFGFLTGIDGVKPKRQIEIAPYVLAQAESFEAVEGNPFATGQRSRLSAGVDAKMGITNNTTLDLTVLPDFGQVEADPSEVNLTAFETHFSERRPFFVEGRNLFDYALTDYSVESLFYSRRIGRSPQGSPELDEGEHSQIPLNAEIMGAAKVTGRGKDGISFGILNAVTNRAHARIDSSGYERTQEVEPLTNYIVGSLQKDFNEGQTRVTALVTSTNRNINTPELSFMHTNAFSGGAQFTHWWNSRNYYLNVKAYGSHVMGSTKAIERTQKFSSRFFQRPDITHVSFDSTRTSLTGHGGNIGFGKDGDGHWQYAAFLNWKSPGLEVNDIGYNTLVDDISQVLWFGYRYWEPFLFFKQVNVNFSQWMGHNFAGVRSYLGGEVEFETQFKNNWEIELDVEIQDRVMSYSALRGGPSLIIPGGINPSFYISTDTRRKLSLWANASLFEGKANRSRSVYSGLVYKPLSSLSVALTSGNSYSNYTLQYVSNIEWEGEWQYVNASLTQYVTSIEFRTDYSITPELSLQLYARPFFARGHYYDFKYITNPHAANFFDRFITLSDQQVEYNAIEEEYSIDANSDGATDYTLTNPDFNFRALQSNFVIRWEYLPGSTLFLVWTQGRESFDTDYSLPFGESNRELFRTFPHNVFLVKLSYRFY